MSASKSSAPDGTRALKIIVISMGIALIGGTILLFALAFKKVGAEKAVKPQNPVSVLTACEPQKLSLDAGEAISKLSYRDGMTIIESTFVNGERAFRVVDGCRGEVLQKIIFSNPQQN